MKKLHNPPTVYGQMLYEWLLGKVRSGTLSQRDLAELVEEWYEPQQ